MNILIPQLEENRGALAQFLHRRAPLGSSDRVALGELMSSEAVPATRSAIRSREQSSPDVRLALSQGYVNVLDTQSWDDAVHQTRVRPPMHAHRWVSFVAASPDIGVSAPDDDSAAQEITAFVDLPSGAMALSIPLSGPPRVEVLDGPHCALPTRGQCAPGCGSCALHEVLGSRSGLVCFCDHER